MVMSLWPRVFRPTLYVCTERLCSRRPYSLDCHGGAMGMYHCALENITVSRCAKNWVSDSDGSRTDSGTSKHPVRNRPNFFVHIALSYSTRWRACLALLNVNDSDWRLLRPGCITRRGIGCRLFTHCSVGLSFQLYFMVSWLHSSVLYYFVLSVCCYV